jgi:hypothetical protein
MLSILGLIVFCAIYETISYSQNKESGIYMESDPSRLIANAYEIDHATACYIVIDSKTIKAWESYCKRARVCVFMEIEYKGKTYNWTQAQFEKYLKMSDVKEIKK